MVNTQYKSICSHYGLLHNNESNYDKLNQYVELILKWSKAYNLTGTATHSLMWQHVVGCLPVNVFLTSATNCLDLGSGAGLPAIVSAIHSPHVNFNLLDSNGKKCRFLQHVAQQLQLKNVTVTQSRIEHFDNFGFYDIISARALTSLDKLVMLATPFLTTNGSIVALKGSNIEVEQDNLLKQNNKLAISYYPINLANENHQVLCIDNAAH